MAKELLNEVLPLMKSGQIPRKKQDLKAGSYYGGAVLALLAGVGAFVITRADAAVPQSIFGMAVPGSVADHDTKPVEVGVKFRADRDGVSPRSASSRTRPTRESTPVRCGRPRALGSPR